MTEREVDVEASFSVIVDEGSPSAARSEVASRVLQAIKEIEGVTGGGGVGTTGGKEVDDGE